MADADSKHEYKMTAEKRRRFDIQKRVFNLYAPHLYDYYKNDGPIDQLHDNDIFTGLLVAFVYDNSRKREEDYNPSLTTSGIVHHFRMLERKGIVKLRKSFQNNAKKLLKKADGILENSEVVHKRTIRKVWYLTPEAKKYIEGMRTATGILEDYKDTFNAARYRVGIREEDIEVTVDIKKLLSA